MTEDETIKTSRELRRTETTDPVTRDYCTDQSIRVCDCVSGSGSASRPLL